MWQQWGVVLLGLWVMALPFITMSADAFAWTLIVTGALVAILGVWGVRETTVERKDGRMVHRTQH